MTERIETKPRIKVEPGSIVEVDIVRGEQVLIPNIKAQFLEPPAGLEVVRIEFLTSHQKYDLSKSLVETTGQCGMIRFHQPGGEGRVDKA